MSDIMPRFIEGEPPLGLEFVITRIRPNGSTSFVSAYDAWEYSEMQRVVSHTPDLFRDQFKFGGCPLENRPTYEQTLATRRKQSRIYLGTDMNEVWQFTNQQTSHWFLKQFHTGDKLCMTSFTGGKSFDMSQKDIDIYLIMKAKDIDNGVTYFDNQFVSSGKCRLAIEFDLKLPDEFEGWRQKFKKDSLLVIEMASVWFGEDAQCTAHILTRYPCHTKTGWKYGMHLIFEHLRVDIDEGIAFSKGCQELFPQDADDYVDGIYRNGLARLRPAYARKLEREDGELFGSLFYYYSWTVDDMHHLKRYAWDTVTILRKTSLV
jgi:hypothetical protein